MWALDRNVFVGVKSNWGRANRKGFISCFNHWRTAAQRSLKTSSFSPWNRGWAAISTATTVRQATSSWSFPSNPFRVSRTFWPRCCSARGSGSARGRRTCATARTQPLSPQLRTPDFTLTAALVQKHTQRRSVSALGGLERVPEAPRPQKSDAVTGKRPARKTHCCHRGCLLTEGG